MGKEIRIKCRKIYGGKATGEALVTREAVSGWGGTDPLAGKIIERAGGHVMTDTCPAMARVFPEGTRTAATNSAKQAHYFPSLTGIGTYYGSTEECIQAAITGKWGGRL